eukprot:TRINITY_DN16249_c0_g2_i2.p1 TRINITY_DN16249_c0_g2~~TRINITY_DN16249_c0_g2_i2.p1  ORF type:complete len:270 (-),score=82.26 TRINITY_DN16249_c0_g2_i2:143-865(-)
MDAGKSEKELIGKLEKDNELLSKTLRIREEQLVDSSRIMSEYNEKNLDLTETLEGLQEQIANLQLKLDNKDRQLIQEEKDKEIIFTGLRECERELEEYKKRGGEFQAIFDNFTRKVLVQRAQEAKEDLKAPYLQTLMTNQIQTQDKELVKNDEAREDKAISTAIQAENKISDTTSQEKAMEAHKEEASKIERSEEKASPTESKSEAKVEISDTKEKIEVKEEVGLPDDILKQIEQDFGSL